MPALPRNCYKTPHGFAFRVVVPEALRQALGKREIKKTLGNDYRKAVSVAHILSLQVSRQFDELRDKIAQCTQSGDALATFLASPVDTRLTPITQATPELVAGLRSLWLGSLDADLKWRRAGLDDDEHADLDQNVAQMQEAIAQALARGRADMFVPVVRNLLLGRGYQLTLTPEDERQLVLDVLPALQEGYDILAQRQKGRLVESTGVTAPPLPASWEPPSAAVDTGLTWKQLLDHWRDDRERPGKTVNEVEGYVNAIAALFPQTSPETLTRAQVTDWLRNERETRGNGARTLEKKGTLVGALFSVALKDELLEKNPFSNFDYSRFATKEGMEDPDDRDPFTLDQLKRIFSKDEGVFATTKLAGGGGYHARVWMPLLALYSGARIDEIGSLRLSDILSDPVHHFRIRKGKTQSSVRDVPLHPKLIELGFLDYVEAIRSAGHDSLWPHLNTRSATANDSEVLGKWFNRYLHTKLHLPSTVVFHSFRHTFKDLCRDALIPRDLHHALTGHAKNADEKKNVGDDYGKGFSLETKLAQIRKIEVAIELPKPEPYAAPARSRQKSPSRVPK